MEIFKSVSELQAWRGLTEENYFKIGSRVTIGFVPTMGALHEGHISLLERSRAENDLTVLSIFVNPTQFNNPDDLVKYPKSTARDLEIAHRAGVDAVFIPSNSEELYYDGYRYQVLEKEFSKTLEGEFRPGHFEGMLTVVLKLLNIVRATKAYFGEKDYQQLELIQGMARAFFLETEIVGCPTVREEDGLAMSSRNLRLSVADRAVAPRLHSALVDITDLQSARATLEKVGFKVEYLVDQGKRRLVAAHLGDVRLIDNVERGL